MAIIKLTNQNANIITAGTFGDGRISASSVNQHATDFDDNKIVNDLSTLGLRVHTQENLNVSNTNSASFDVFQDSTGITNLTNVSNVDEYLTSIVGTALPNNTVFYLKGGNANGNTTFTDTSSNNITINASGGVVHSDNAYKIGSTSIYFDGNGDYLSGSNNSNFHFGTGEFHIETYFRSPNITSTYNTIMVQGGWGTSTDYAGWTFMVTNDKKIRFQSSGNNNGSHGSWPIYVVSGALTMNNNTWYHVAVSRASDGVIRMFLDGTEVDGYISGTGKTGSVSVSTGDRDFKIGTASDETTASQNEMFLDNLVVLKGSGVGKSSSFTPTTSEYGQTVSATGSFEGATITAGASTSSMGAVITYQDNAGTNTLNTDIILKLSANNGSNYSTATLTALPDFATGIKMAKVNDLSVTAGTQLKYKIEFANQSSGSKEARIRGVSLQY